MHVIFSNNEKHFLTCLELKDSAFNSVPNLLSVKTFYLQYESQQFLRIST
jgi:hypothetical protein